ncbi:hypothetical protein MMC06_000064 [Schaereria dolodes]|nr:hypothetical protein [Schaereria dolodes]
MDSSLRSSGAIIGQQNFAQLSPLWASTNQIPDRANANVAQLLKRFENIIALAPVEGHDRNSTAVEAFQMEVETAALIKAAEEILSLTRSLKEAWLFGQLDTIGDSPAQGKTEEHATAVVNGLVQAMERGGTKVRCREKVQKGSG